MYLKIASQFPDTLLESVDNVDGTRLTKKAYIYARRITKTHSLLQWSV